MKDKELKFEEIEVSLTLIKNGTGEGHRLVFSLLGGEYTLRKDSILVFV